MIPVPAQQRDGGFSLLYAQCAVGRRASRALPRRTCPVSPPAAAPAGSELLCWQSGHRNNVFQARFMPHTDNSVLVSCAADGQVTARWGFLAAPVVRPCGRAWDGAACRQLLPPATYAAQ